MRIKGFITALAVAVAVVVPAGYRHPHFADSASAATGPDPALYADWLADIDRQIAGEQLARGIAPTLSVPAAPAQAEPAPGTLQPGHLVWSAPPAGDPPPLAAPLLLPPRAPDLRLDRRALPSGPLPVLRLGGLIERLGDGGLIPPDGPVADPLPTVAVALAGPGMIRSPGRRAPLIRRDRASRFEIESSLFGSGRRAGVPAAVMLAVIRIFSHEVDFQRDLHPGDRFALLYESVETETGERIAAGEILYASLTLADRERSVYRYKTPDGVADYFDRSGESFRKALLRTPVDGARLTSRFGMRRHPILGYSKMHRGVDFGAPTGTPVFAAGNGVVVDRGWHGGYGNYLRIRHTGEIETAYAHLSAFTRGLDRGSVVRQGQLIAKVGSTGRSTGPHLHFEVLRAGRQVNPLSIDHPIRDRLAGAALASYRKFVREVDSRMERGLGNVQVVELAGSGRPSGKPD